VYYGMESPWVKISTDLDTDNPSMTLRCEHFSLVEQVMFNFLGNGMHCVVENLKNSLVQIAGGIPDEQWVENCSEQRKSLEVRIHDLDTARGQLVSLLGKSEEELLAAAAKRVGCSTCQCISHTDLSQGIAGTAVNKEERKVRFAARVGTARISR